MTAAPDQPRRPLDGLIDELFARPDDQGISLAFVAQQRGEVIAERYGVQPENLFQPAIAVTADTTLTSWSMAKSITHAALGVLVADGLVDVAAPAAVPEWEGTDKAEITLLHLLEMRSGLRFVEDYVDDEVSHCIEMLFGESGPSHGAYAAALPLDHAPGTFYNYSSGTTNIIARIIGDLVYGAVGGEPDERRNAIESFLHERLLAPVGMASAIPKFDGAGDFVGSSYVYATALDFAKFGELYRHDGVTSAGVRILPEGWSTQARGFSALDPDNGCEYGRHWWMWPEIPGSLVCHGHEGQYVVVVPDRELVVVHLGKTPSDESAKLRARLRDIIRLF
ncbi:MAG TPA: serine hydrolase [Ilumatobacteraceae bacterium]|nr:serine hydrolase [Ilumatobacteraceae bacterium]